MSSLDSSLHMEAMRLGCPVLSGASYFSVKGDFNCSNSSKSSPFSSLALFVWFRALVEGIVSHIDKLWASSLVASNRRKLGGILPFRCFDSPAKVPAKHQISLGELDFSHD